MTTPTAELEPTATEPARPPRRGDRLALLDGLRFVAAAAVLLFHYTARTTRVWDAKTLDLFPHLHPVTRYGYLGVDLFFVISGFVVLMTAWGRDVPSFVASRVGRLFPAYWTGVLLTGGLLLVTGSAVKDVSPMDVVTNLTMVQSATGVQHVDGVYWTLWVELRFYLLLGLLALVGITRNRVIALAVVWPVATALSAGHGDGWFQQLLMPGQAPLFATGMLLHLAHREGLRPGLALLVGFDVALSLTWAYHDLDNIADATGGTANGLVAALVVLACIGLVALVTLTPLRRLSWRWPTALGALTYSLYLLHENWGFFVIDRLHDRLSAPVTVLCAAGVSVVLAVLVHRLVERPLGPVLRRWTLATFDRPAGARSGR